MSYTMIEILTIAEFLGENMTNDQADTLMDHARELGIRDKEILKANLPGTPLYTEMSMHEGEMGGFSRY
jgi:hypothetical protein